MQKNNHHMDQRGKMERILGMALHESSGNLSKGECLSLEEIARLTERKIARKKRDQMLTHLSQCEDCYQTFMISAELVEKPEKSGKAMEKPVLFRPLALAASVVVVVFSLFILYKTGTLTRISKQSILKSEIEPKSSQRVPEPGYIQKEKDQMKRTDETAKIRIPGKTGLIIADKKIGQKEKPSPSGQPQDIPVQESSSRKLPGTQRELEVPRPSATKADATVGLPLAEEKGEAEYPGKTELKSSAARGSESGLLESEVAGRYRNGQIKFFNTYKMIQNQRVMTEKKEYDYWGRMVSVIDLQADTRLKFGYYPDGNKKFREEYQKGKPHGTWIQWNHEGEVIEKIIYEEGKLIEKNSDE